MANFYLTLPLVFLRFWFVEAPMFLIAYFASLNKAFLELFSLPLMLKTYFSPWKNEYREGLVITAIFLGIVIKTFAIFTDLVLLLLLLGLELVFILSFILWPIGTILILVI